MAGFNPFAPDLEKQQKAPQLQGIQAPNVQMTEQPGLIQTLAPSVFSKAMDSKAAGKASDYIGGKAKEAWNAFNPASPEVIPVSELSNVMGATTTPNGILASEALGTGLASQAATAATLAPQGALAAEALGTGLAATSAPIATTAASLAPAAGPFAPLVMLGAGLLAANSGK